MWPLQRRARPESGRPARRSGCTAEGPRHTPTPPCRAEPRPGRKHACLGQHSAPRKGEHVTITKRPQVHKDGWEGAERGEWSRALTCVHIPRSHQDPDPAPQEEADLLRAQHLLDGRESLKAEGERGASGTHSGREGWAGVRPDPPEHCRVGVGDSWPLSVRLVGPFTSGILLVIRGESAARVVLAQVGAWGWDGGPADGSPGVGHSLGTLLARGSNSGSRTVFRHLSSTQEPAPGTQNVDLASGTLWMTSHHSPGFEAELWLQGCCTCFEGRREGPEKQL